ncbi:EF-hand, partial [Bimuria novae-zelandiae CBS 107.79]
RPTTPGSSPLKPTPGNTPLQAPLRNSTVSNASQNPPPWLSTRGASLEPEMPRSPSRQVSSSTQHTIRPLNTASIAARFDGGASTPPPERPFERTLGRPMERTSSIEQLPALSQPASIDQPPPLRPTPQPTPRTAMAPRASSTDALSKIPPPLLHSMRESFSVLDRDNSGRVDAADVAEMLSQLGLSATPSTLASYFPDGAKFINLATYLNTISDLLSGLSHPSELNAAFEAFDDGDDGQIDLGELKDALLHTAPEHGERKLTEREIDMVVEGFSGRRAFGKGGKGLGRGEVFRYQEFVASVTGGGNSENGAGAAAPA